VDATSGYEYRLINEGSRDKAEKRLSQAIDDGWELAEFRTGGGSMGYEFVFLLRRVRGS
jgi:hypothetical protein